MAQRSPATGVAQLLELVDVEWRRLLSALERERQAVGGAGRLAGGWSGGDVLSHARLYDAWLLGMLEPAQREVQMPYRSYLTPDAELHARNRHHVEADRSLPEDSSQRQRLPKKGPSKPPDPPLERPPAVRPHR